MCYFIIQNGFAQVQILSEAKKAQDLTLSLTNRTPNRVHLKNYTQGKINHSVHFHQSQTVYSCSHSMCLNKSIF